MTKESAANTELALLAAGIANIVSHCFFHPVNVLLSNWQINKKRFTTINEFNQVFFATLPNGNFYTKFRFLYNGFFVAGIHKISKGVRGFYRGITLRLLLSLPKKSLPLALSGYFLELMNSTVNSRKLTK